VNPSIESEFKGSGPRKVIKLGESCPCQATGLADEAPRALRFGSLKYAKNACSN